MGVVERAQQRVADVTGGRRGVHAAEYVDGPSRLLDVAFTFRTCAQVPFESLELDGSHRAFEVLGDQLDRLLALVRIMPMPDPVHEVGDTALL
ncbi:MAG TPA: hypothetical protein VES40_14130 [Ilumatobacteraceae bacterium]|nr:hypothetical protein [Ilumatobacteraceae bacterium]